MKLSLVVAQGVHSGKSIPITVTDFVIGRDPQCQLRPASPAVSKQHCGISQREGKVFVRDCGSTNGTFVNDEQVAGDKEVKDGDKIRVGPLEFTIRVETLITQPDASKKTPSTGDTLVNEATVISSPKLPAAKPAAAAPAAVVPSTAASRAEEADDAAAMLLGMDDGPTGTAPTIGNFNPDSTTVIEMPALAEKKNDPAKDDKKKANTSDSSNAAAELLSKYMRRPRT